MSSRLRYWRTRSWVDQLLCTAQDAAIDLIDRDWSPDDGEVPDLASIPVLSTDPLREHEIDGFVYGEFLNVG